MVPGVSRELLEREHLARYRFACEFASHRTVLDVAWGMGYSAPLFMAAGTRCYTEIDLDEDAIAAASKQYAVTDGVRFQVGDACELAGLSPHRDAISG